MALRAGSQRLFLLDDEGGINQRGFFLLQYFKGKAEGIDVYAGSLPYYQRDSGHLVQSILLRGALHNKDHIFHQGEFMHVDLLIFY